MKRFWGASAVITGVAACLAPLAAGADSSSVYSRATWISGDLVDAAAELDRLRGPARYTALRRIWAQWDTARPDHVEEALLNASSNPSLSPALVAYSKTFINLARRRRGDIAGAQRRFAELGYVNRWLVVGPFDNEGKAGFDLNFEPETQFAEAMTPGRGFSGKGRVVRWREAPHSFELGKLNLSRLLRPYRHACAFATSFVRGTNKATIPVSLWVGSAGAVKVYWNGEAVLKDPVERGHDFGRRARQVSLHSGYNNLTLKICVANKKPQISVRIGSRNGAVLGDLKFSTELPASVESGKLVSAISSRATTRRPSSAARGAPLDEFERRVQRKKPRAADLEAFSRYLTLTRGDDETTHLARNLAQRAVALEETGPRLLLAAKHSEDRNVASVWLSRAEPKLQGRRERVEWLLAQAAWHASGLSPDSAFGLYQQVLAIDPENIVAIAQRSKMLKQAGLRQSATAILQRALDRQPESGRLLELYSSSLSALGRDTEALEIANRRSAFDTPDLSFVSSRIDLALSRRNDEQVSRWVSRLLSISPNSQWAHGVAARAYRAQGASDRAVASYEQALRLAPDDVGTLRKLGDLEGSLAHPDEQLRRLRRILELRPQAKEVRQYLDHLEPQSARLDESYAHEPARFLKDRNATAEGQSQRTLLKLSVTQVFPNGLASNFTQVVFQPLSASAAAVARQYAFRYQADRQRVQLRGARVFRADGSIDQAIESGEGAADNPALRMYTSDRTFVVSFPRLEAGDVVELKYRIDDVAARNEFGDYFGEVVPFGSSEPVGHAEHVLITPAARKLYVDVVGLPKMKRDTDKRGKLNIERFVVKGLAAQAPEPAMPPWPEVLGFVHISTFANYQEMGHWYWGLAKDQFDLDEDTRKLATSLGVGKTTTTEKVRAVYNWVVQNTRYVALEFGIHGFKPRRCVQTVARGWGDCKDKATVIVSLLRALGIDSTIVILRANQGGDFRSKVSSLAAFNHAIAYVPELDLYLDGTAEYTGMSELPAMDRGALALLVNGGNSKLTHLPKITSTPDEVRRKLRLRLRADRRAALDIEYAVTGTHASWWRRRYSASSSKKQRLAEYVTGEFPGFEVRGTPRTQGLNDIDRSVSVKLRGRLNRFARSEGSGVLSLSLTPSLRLTPRFASLSKRKLPVALPTPGTQATESELELPPGMKFLSVPAASAKTSPFGNYEMVVRQSEKSVTVSTSLQLTVDRIAPEQYAAWRQFCATFDSAVDQRVRIQQ